MRPSIDNEKFRSNGGGSGWSRPLQSDRHANGSGINSLIDLRGRLLNFPDCVQTAGLHVSAAHRIICADAGK
jgi:hypothetical protein